MHTALAPGIHPGLEPGLWPASTRAAGVGDLEIAGVRLTGLAAQFGTPTYVLDEEEVRRRCRAYRAAFPDATIGYAAKRS